MSGELLRSVVRGVTRNVAFTAPDADDPRLRGRTYAIPFEDVWRTSLELVRGGLKGWEVVEADDQEGVIRGRSGSWLPRSESSLTVRITLDVDAQTRVDALSASKEGRFDLGANARRLRRFFRELDKRLEEARGARIEALRLDL